MRNGAAVADAMVQFYSETEIARSPASLSPFESSVYTDHAMDCIFCKIIAGTIPAKPVYQDELAFAFADISPQAPTHLLIVPREHIKSLDEANGKRDLLGHLTTIAANLAKENNLGKGYRVVINTG